MANKQRGEVEVKGEDGRIYLLKLGTNALCQLEEKLDRPVLVLFDELQQGKIRLTTVREFLKVASLPPIDDEAAAQVIDSVGVLPMLAAMTESILVVFQADAPKKTNGAGNPHKPAKKKQLVGAGNSSAPPK